jgi:hypothetical protein
MEVLMRVLYLFDQDEADRREAGSALAVWAEKGGHEAVLLCVPGLKPCLGSFGCWIKTPGQCVVKGDKEDSLITEMYRADLVLLGGETPYGCFSPPIKAALDRAIPLLLPYFRKYRGEMSHLPRYSRLPRFLSVSFGEAHEYRIAETMAPNAATEADLGVDFIVLAFHEGVQNKGALDIIVNFRERAGITWKGGAGIGTGEMMANVRNAPDDMFIKRPHIAEVT